MRQKLIMEFSTTESAGLEKSFPLSGFPNHGEVSPLRIRVVGPVFQLAGY